MIDTEKSILYIEDNPSNMRLVEQILHSRPGIRFHKAYEPTSGLDLARQCKPDLVLLDISLPNMDGYDVLKALRNQAGNQSILVIAVTAKAMAEDINKGIAAGFDDYITKPINVTTFLDAIDNALAD